MISVSGSRYRFTSLLLILMPALLLGAESEPMPRFTLEHEGQEREYFVYVPPGADGPLPVVLAIHGYTSTATGFANAHELNEHAARNGYIAVYPQGTHFLVEPENSPAFRITAWNSYDEDGPNFSGPPHCTAESAVSLTGLAHQLGYRLSLPEWESHPLNAVEGSKRDKAKQLRELAADGDPLAQQLFADQAQSLGLTLLNANYLGDYDLIVIGGGVCDLAPDVRESYRKTAEEAYLESALDGFRNFDRFQFSVCGDDAAVIGAMAFAIRHAEYSR